MAFRALRSIPVLPRSSASLVAVSAPRRGFHATPRAFVQVGDSVPDIELHEDSPGNKVSLAAAYGSGIDKGVIIGVPAAFSGSCSQKHVPSYINHPKISEAGQVFVVSVNDAFVMKAWSDQLDPTKLSGIRFLADPTGEFTKTLDLGFDAIPVFGHTRAKRYALVIEQGKVKSVHVEPDNTGTDVSMADKVLG